MDYSLKHVYHWISSGDCAKCSAMQGVHDDEPVRPHPNCQCAIIGQTVICQKISETTTSRPAGVRYEYVTSIDKGGSAQKLVSSMTTGGVTGTIGVKASEPGGEISVAAAPTVSTSSSEGQRRPSSTTRMSAEAACSRRVPDLRGDDDDDLESVSGRRFLSRDRDHLAGSFRPLRARGERPRSSRIARIRRRRPRRRRRRGQRRRRLRVRDGRGNPSKAAAARTPGLL